MKERLLALAVIGLAFYFVYQGIGESANLIEKLAQQLGTIQVR